MNRFTLTNPFCDLVVKGVKTRRSPLGSPQGSVLGPVLVLVNINDITGVKSSSLQMTLSKVYRIIYDENDEKRLQCDLSMLQEWSVNWQLLFNSTLTNVRFHVLPMREITQAILVSVLVAPFSLSAKRLIWGSH